MCTFLYYSHSKRHSFSIEIPLEKRQLPGYPEFPVTVGEHIRKKRMDLGLLQREVADSIGVTESSVWKWEHGVEPEQHYNPNIIKFLGYVSFDCPDETVGRLAWYKRVNGLTLNELGQQMRRHPDQLLQECLIRGRTPFIKSLQHIELFLASSDFTRATLETMGQQFVWSALNISLDYKNRIIPYSLLHGL